MQRFFAAIVLTLIVSLTSVRLEAGTCNQGQFYGFGGDWGPSASAVVASTFPVGSTAVSYAIDSSSVLFSVNLRRPNITTRRGSIRFAIRYHLEQRWDNASTWSWVASGVAWYDRSNIGAGGTSDALSIDRLSFSPNAGRQWRLVVDGLDVHSSTRSTSVDAFGVNELWILGCATPYTATPTLTVTPSHSPTALPLPCTAPFVASDAAAGGSHGMGFLGDNNLITGTPFSSLANGSVLETIDLGSPRSLAAIDGIYRIIYGGSGRPSGSPSGLLTLGVQSAPSPSGPWTPAPNAAVSFYGPAVQAGRSGILDLRVQSPLPGTVARYWRLTKAGSASPAGSLYWDASLVEADLLSCEGSQYSATPSVTSTATRTPTRTATPSATPLPTPCSFVLSAPAAGATHSAPLMADALLSTGANFDVPNGTTLDSIDLGALRSLQAIEVDLRLLVRGGSNARFNAGFQIQVANSASGPWQSIVGYSQIVNVSGLNPISSTQVDRSIRFSLSSIPYRHWRVQKGAWSTFGGLNGTVQAVEIRLVGCEPVPTATPSATPSSTRSATRSSSPTRSATSSRTASATRSPTRSFTATPTPLCAGFSESAVVVAELNLQGVTHCASTFSPPPAANILSASVAAGLYRVSVVPVDCAVYNPQRTLYGAGARWGTLIDGAYLLRGTVAWSPATPNPQSCEALFADGGVVTGGDHADGLIELSQDAELWFTIGDSTCSDNLGSVRVRIERLQRDCASATASPSPSETASPTASPSATETASATQTGSPTESPTPSATDSPTRTVTETPTPTATLTASQTLSATPTASGSPTASPSPTSTASPSQTTTAVDRATPLATPTHFNCNAWQVLGTPAQGASAAWTDGGITTDGAALIDGDPSTGAALPNPVLASARPQLVVSFAQPQQPSFAYLTYDLNKPFPTQGQVHLYVNLLADYSANGSGPWTFVATLATSHLPEVTLVQLQTRSYALPLTAPASRLRFDVSSAGSLLPNEPWHQFALKDLILGDCSGSTATPSATLSWSASPSPSISATSTLSPSPTQSGTPTGTETASASATPTGTRTPTASPTASATAAPFCCPIPTFSRFYDIAAPLPMDVAGDEQGRLWTLFNDGSLRRLVNGAAQDSIPVPGAMRVRFDAQGRIYTLAGQQLQRRPAAGGAPTEITLPFAPSYRAGFTVLNDGTVCLADSSGSLIHRYDGSLNALPSISLSGPQQLSQDSQGRLIAQGSAGAVLRYDGTVPTTLFSNGSLYTAYVEGIGFVGHRNIAGAWNVQVYSSTGAVLCTRAMNGLAVFAAGNGGYASVEEGFSGPRGFGLAEFLACDPAFTATLTRTPTATRTQTEDLTITRTASGTPSATRTVTPPPCNQCTATNAAYAFGGGSLAVTVGNGGDLRWLGSPAAPVFGPLTGPGYSFMSVSGFRFGGRLDVAASGAQSYNSTGFWALAYDGMDIEPGELVLYDWASGRRRVRAETVPGSNGQFRVRYSTAGGEMSWLSPVGSLLSGPHSDRASASRDISTMSQLRFTIRDCTLGVNINANTGSAAPQHVLPYFDEDPALPPASYQVVGNSVDGNFGFDGILTGVWVQGCFVPSPTASPSRTASATQSQTFTISPTFSVSPTITPTSTATPSFTPDPCPACSSGRGGYDFNQATLNSLPGSSLAPAVWTPGAPSFMGPSGLKVLSGFRSSNGWLDLSGAGADLGELTVQFLYAQISGLNNTPQLLLDWSEGGRWVQLWAFSPGHANYSRIEVRYSGDGGQRSLLSGPGLYGIANQSSIQAQGNLFAVPGSAVLALALRDCGLRFMAVPIITGGVTQFLAADDLQPGAGVPGDRLLLGNGSGGGQGFNGVIDEVLLADCQLQSPTLTRTLTALLSPTPTVTATPSSTERIPPTPELSATPSSTETASTTGSPTQTATPTATQTATQSASPSPTPSETGTLTASPTVSGSATESSSPTPSASPTPSVTAACGFVPGPILATGPVSAAASDSADGSFWVQSGYGPAHLLHFGPDGALLEDRIIGASAFGATSMVVDLDGSLLLVRGGLLYRAREGAPVLVPGISFSGIYSVVLGPDGSLYAFEDGYQVRKLQRSGPDSWTFAWLAPLPGVSFGRTVAVMDDGSVLVPVVLNGSSNAVLRLSATGALVGSLPLGYRVSGGIAIGSDGMLVLNEATWSGGTAARLHRIDPVSGAELSQSLVPAPPLNITPSEMPLQAGADGRVFIWHQGSSQAWMAQPCDLPTPTATSTVTPSPSATPSPTATGSSTPTPSFSPSPWPCVVDSGSILTLRDATLGSAALDPSNGGMVLYYPAGTWVEKRDSQGALLSSFQLFPGTSATVHYGEMAVHSSGSIYFNSGGAGLMEWDGLSVRYLPIPGLTSVLKMVMHGDEIFFLEMISGTQIRVRRLTRSAPGVLTPRFEALLPAGVLVRDAFVEGGYLRMVGYDNAQPTVNIVESLDMAGNLGARQLIPITNINQFVLAPDGRYLLVQGPDTSLSPSRFYYWAYDPATQALTGRSEVLTDGVTVGNLDLVLTSAGQLLAFGPNVAGYPALLSPLCSGAAPAAPLGGARLALGAPKDADAVPAQAALLIAPNPFAGSGVIQASLPRAAQARVLVMDLQGAVVHAADLGALGAGVYQAPLDLRGLASGIYLAQLQLNHGEGWGLGARFKLALVR